MSTATTPDVDWELISEINSDIPCAVRVNGQPCGQPAQWWLLVRRHASCSFTDRPLIEWFSCDEHQRRVMQGEVAQCNGCGHLYMPRVYLVRTERIR